ncbi:peroxiredoxin (alkyl hydroperoxide reductase subunit C) [Luteibacter sp. UNCMF366Tsu5.1]|nr:peroxiredoxin (alkyl hydroperoxide reductase subunit C) [Luteibacter sp. UNCMF366Tsu5.1]
MESPLNAAFQTPRPLRLNEHAPDFRARTTQGDVSLSDYRGRWLVLFSHPADFTPVCTSEFMAFAQAAAEFAALDCALLALSIDGLYAHLAWIRDINERWGVAIDFPIIEDPSMAIAQGYGMLAPDAADSATARITYVIDPEGVIRAMNWYPMEVGRSVPELLRLVAALQTSDRHAVATPEGWRPGSPVLERVETDASKASAIQPRDGESWYFRWRPCP